MKILITSKAKGGNISPIAMNCSQRPIKGAAVNDTICVWIFGAPVQLSRALASFTELSNLKNKKKKLLIKKGKTLCQRTQAFCLFQQDRTNSKFQKLKNNLTSTKAVAQIFKIEVVINRSLVG